MNQRKDATDREWEQRAREDAAALGLPEAEVRRQTRAALFRIVAEAIARDEVKKRRARQAPPPTVGVLGESGSAPRSRLTLSG